MKIKLIPCRYADPESQMPDTEVSILDPWSVKIDNEIYSFDPSDVEWPTVNEDTKGVILEAHLEHGELYVTVLRMFTKRTGWQSWYSEDYQ